MVEETLSGEIWKIEDFDDRVLGLIRGGKLPMEVVTGVMRPTPRVWNEILQQAPMMNMLMNLNTYKRHKVLQNPKNVEHIVGKLTSEEAITRSRLLPFRFYAAYRHFEGEPAIEEALRTAIDLSFINVPKIPGKVCIAPDVSGSMWMPISQKSKLQCIDIAGVFAAAIMKKCDSPTVLPFGTEVHTPKFAPTDSIMTIAQSISSIRGGGTHLAAPLEELIRRREHVDIFIGITDSEEWVGRGFLDAWGRYKEINDNAKAFLIQIVSYKDRVVPPDEPNVWYIYGWSDKVLDYIGMQLSDRATMVDDVRAIELVEK